MRGAWCVGGEPAVGAALQAAEKREGLKVVVCHAAHLEYTVRANADAIGLAFAPASIDLRLVLALRRSAELAGSLRIPCGTLRFGAIERPARLAISGNIAGNVVSSRHEPKVGAEYAESSPRESRF
jgi:hypothetical protein